MIASRIENISNIPSLRDYIHRARVLKLYRALIRETNQSPDSFLRKSLREQIRCSFKTGSTIADKAAIKFMLSDGERSLEKIKAMSQFHLPRYLNKKNSLDDELHKLGQGWPWERKR